MNIDIDITGVVLKTDRLTLRAFKEDDLNDFYEYAKVEGVGEMAGWPYHKDINETKMILDMFIDGKKVFAIVKDDKVIGSLGIEKYDEESCPELSNKKGREIGYVLSKEYWGNGLMSEAVKEVVRYLFETVKVDFILSGHFKRNPRSARVQEKNGFKYFKDHIYETRYGSKEDSVYSIIYKEDYQGK